MGSSKPTINLYWVCTHDHNSDWFVFAVNGKQAQAFHERAEDLRSPYGDYANARLIVFEVTLEKFMNGTPPCHAGLEDLNELAQDAGTMAGRRKERLNGEIFQDGILEAIIELSRQPGVKTGPRLVIRS